MKVVDYKIELEIRELELEIHLFYLQVVLSFGFWWPDIDD